MPAVHGHPERIACFQTRNECGQDRKQARLNAVDLVAIGSTEGTSIVCKSRSVVLLTSPNAEERTWISNDMTGGLELLNRNLGPLREQKHVPILVSHDGVLVRKKE